MLSFRCPAGSGALPASNTREMSKSTIPQRSRTAHGAAYIRVGNGEPVLLIHGVGLRLEAWSAQIEALAATHEVIAVDMPGHGQSMPLSENARIEDFVDWLEDVIGDLGCGPLNLCGHSMGALISMGFSLTRPSLVRRIALICGVYQRADVAREAVLARASGIAKGHLDVDGPLARWYVPNRSNRESLLVEMTRDWLSGMSQASYGTAYRAFAEGDAMYAAQLGELTCPALFLTGELDPNSTPQMTRQMAAVARNGRAVVVPGEKHMVHLVAPEPVNDALRVWLRVSPQQHFGETPWVN